jgi:hypothetical protein
MDGGGKMDGGKMEKGSTSPTVQSPSPSCSSSPHYGGKMDGGKMDRGKMDKGSTSPTNQSPSPSVSSTPSPSGKMDGGKMDSKSSSGKMDKGKKRTIDEDYEDPTIVGASTNEQLNLASSAESGKMFAAAVIGVFFGFLYM